MLEIFMTGFLLNAGLFLGIGPQNTYVIRQGLRGEHILAVYLVCMFGEIILTFIGVFGFGALFSKYVWLQLAVGGCGVFYLLWISFQSFKDATQPEIMVVERLLQRPKLKQVVRRMAVLTFLNPGVYTDTAIIMGGVASNYTFNGKFFFALGTIGAAGIFFAVLGYGSKLVRRWFENVMAIRIIDTIVGVLMFFIAVGLAISLYSSLIQVL